MKYDLLMPQEGALTLQESKARERIPSADLPYFIDHSQSSDGQKQIFSWEYGANKEPRINLKSSGLRIIQGRNSGCIYSAEIDSARLEKIIEDLVNQVNQRINLPKKHDKRFVNNFLYGLVTLQSSHNKNNLN